MPEKQAPGSWGGRGRKVKSCHSDQKYLENARFTRYFFMPCYAVFKKGVTQFATQICVTPQFFCFYGSNASNAVTSASIADLL